MRLEEIEFADQRALALIGDVALLLDEALVSQSRWLGRSCARASITNSALLLECVANSCLFSLALPNKLLEELDKLPALSKLDYYLFATATKHIDRGCRETELAADVIKLRDHVVHPKPKSGRLIQDEEAPYVDYGTTKALGIPFDVREWDHAAAQKIAKAVSSFLRKYFLEWCGLSKSRITTLLVVREKVLIQGDTQSFANMPPVEHAAIEKWLPDILAILDLRSNEVAQPCGQPDAAR